MQNSHSFKSYAIDPSQVAGFKSTLQDLELDSGVAKPSANAGFDTSSLTDYRSEYSKSGDESRVLESKI